MPKHVLNKEISSWKDFKLMLNKIMIIFHSILGTYQVWVGDDQIQVEA